jgi:hypothetical protein
MNSRMGGRIAMGGAGLVVLLLAAGFAAACGGGGGGGGGTPPVCSPKAPIPSAVYITLAQPNKGVPAGGTVSIAYQFEVANYTSADANATVYVPTTYARFNVSSGPSPYTLQLGPQVVNVTGSGWSAAIGKTVTLASALNFTSGGHAFLSTANYAVMIGGAPTNTTLAFRWGWTMNRSGPTTSWWSVPTATPGGASYPSIFEVAPFVQVNDTSNTTAVSGSNFQIALYGAVGKTYFKTAVETPTGKELNCQTETNWWPTSCYVFSIALRDQNGTPLAAGSYLIHIHDSMGAIVAGISITVTNASSGWGWGGHGSGGGSVSCTAPSSHCGGGGWGGWGGGSGCGGGCGNQGGCGGKGGSGRHGHW